MLYIYVKFYGSIFNGFNTISPLIITKGLIYAIYVSRVIWYEVLRNGFLPILFETALRRGEGGGGGVRR